MTDFPFDHSAGDAGEKLDLLLAGMGQGFNAYLERRAAVEQVRRLTALSDAELAGLGLCRADIPAVVLRHMGRGTRAPQPVAR